MGNRAVLSFSTANNAPSIYLHWNGGRASVEGFIAAAKGLGLNNAGTTREQQSKFLDNFADMIAKHFFRCNVGMTVYRETYGQSDYDNGDNGVYVLSPELRITRRLYRGTYEENDVKKTNEIAEHIIQRAPAFNG